MGTEAKPAGWKTAVTIILLILFWPIGVILMFVWMKWPTWLKVCLTILPIVLIGVLSVLLTFALIAINPAKQFATANNTKRMNDVNTILVAVYQYAADDKGVFPPGLSATPQSISSTGTDLCGSLHDYLPSLPEDPLTNNGTLISNCAQPYDTGYTIMKSPFNNRITVAAPAAELGQVISVTR